MNSLSVFNTRPPKKSPKYRLPILIGILLLTAVGIFLAQPWINSVEPSAIKTSCDKIRQCLRVEQAWPPGMEYCPRVLVPGAARHRANGKWGYSVNFEECGADSIIPAKFDVAEKFAFNGLAKVSQGGKWGYVNLKGGEAIPLNYDEVGDFDHGMVPVKRNGKWGYSDAQGLITVPTHFDAVSGIWQDGLSAVLVQGKWGYVNPHGEMAIKPGFDRVTKFQDGLARVQIKRKWGIINTAGELVIQPSFDAIFQTSDPHLLLVARNQKYGYFDDKGKEIIPPHLIKPVRARYNSGGWQIVLNSAALSSASSAAAASYNVLLSAWHFLDTPNEKLRFDENGKAQLWRNGEWFHVSQAGKLINIK
ncbi:MAG: WG repeat-containing protein [Azoarcus sp.]|jgi:hypothetical protein|nr:WG repeat-containing protein [Azoarcus sp.]